MSSDYFEPDIALHPLVVLSPTHDGAAFHLLAHGHREEVGHQITAHHEALRALLCKRAILRPWAGPTDAAPLAVVPFHPGLHVLIVPASEPDAGRFTRRVQILGATDAFADALHVSESIRCAVLVCEVIGLVDGLGPVDAIAWPVAPP